MDAHSTALGKLLLANATLNDQMRFLRKEPLAAHTPNTITDPDVLFRELVRIRAVGYAVDREENEPGILCAGAPVRDFRGAVIAAVSATELLDVSEAHVERKLRLIQEAARQISYAMGAPGGESIGESGEGEERILDRSSAARMAEPARDLDRIP